MKKVIVVTSIEFIIILILTIYILCNGQVFFLKILIPVLLVMAGISEYWVNKQYKIMKFFLEENIRKKAKNMVKWDNEEEQEVKLIKKRIELSYLQEQINPHFLYNTLDCIRSKALIDGHAEIAKMTEILSRFFRYCISNNENLVQVREELNHIQDYYYIQKYRFEDKISMEISVEDESIYDLYMPKMTLQPIVENAMVHGLEKIAEPGKIDIRMFTTDNKLMIIISDNGIGMNREQLVKLNDRMQKQYLNTYRKNDRHSGIALNNVNARLKITFGEECGIHYRSMEGVGTDAVITLPVVDVFTRVRYEDITII